MVARSTTPKVRVRRIDVPLHPVVGRAPAVLLEVGLVGGRGPVEFGAFEEHLADAGDLRAVRILLGLAMGVVLAMHRDPFARDHAGADPVPETQEVRDGRVEIHPAMRLAAVQVQGDGENRELGGHQHVQQDREPAGVRQAVRGKIKKGFEHLGHAREGHGVGTNPHQGV
jgi:hypothetical protein